MDTSKMKNMIVLKDLPSNLVEEAIVVLKENKKVKKYQYIENKNGNCVENDKEKEKKAVNNEEYIVKEAESVINHYMASLEMKSPKWKNNMKKLEKRYKQSIKLNFILGIATIISIIISFI